MSKQSLILCVATLAVAMTLPAQVTNEVTPKKTVEVKSTTAVEKNGANRDLMLGPGSLQQVVGQLEDHYQNKNTTMPTLIWSADTTGLQVPASLRLPDVEPLDALALVAASAGCRLEPIESPEQRKGKTIGYKIVRTESIGWTVTDGRGSTSVSYEGKGSTVRAVPGLPGTGGGGITGVGGGKNSAFASSATKTGTGSTAGGNIREMQEQLLRYQQTLNDEHPRVVELKRELEAAKKISQERPTTRVYAMGGIITGNNEEQALKLDRIKDSISQTLNGEEIDVKGVKINYHDGTNVLVVRAPEAAQELVGQLIEALRENVKAVNSKP